MRTPLTYFFITAFFYFLIQSVAGQPPVSFVNGTVIDQESEPLPGANIILTNTMDSTTRIGVMSDIDGNFAFNQVPNGSYQLRISFVGFQAIDTLMVLESARYDLGQIRMGENSQWLEEVEVVGIRARAEQVGDTTQYNADAFQTNPDASAEDLLTKMPGVLVSDGTVTAQGEQVTRVLVDGSEFFSDDPQLALKNLPAEIIDKVQVYDEKSDQAKFTGFDDGNSSKTINIVTREGKNNGQFGKIYGGYGTDDRYIAGGNLNFFNGDQRISLLALSNNINQQNFSIDDIMGVVSSSSGSDRPQGGGPGGRGGGGRMGGGPRGGGSGGDARDFLVGQQGGISNTNAYGINFSDKYGDKLKINGSYFFNDSRNFNNSILSREYFSSTADGQVYDQTSNTESRNINHRLNLRLNYTINESNSIMVRPSVSWQNYQGGSQLAGSNTLDGDTLSNTQSDNNTDYSGVSFSNDILFRHKFEKERRTFSVNLNTQYNTKIGENQQYSLNNYLEADSIDLVNQRADLDTRSSGVSANVNYTEPLGNGMLMFEYNPSITFSNSDKVTYDLEESGALSAMDTSLSNVYDNIYATQSVGTAYMMRGESSHLMVRLNYQYARLSGNQTFPYDLDLERTFNNVLPMVMYRKKLSDNSNIRVFYRSVTNAPSISQLQGVIDNSNPLQLSTGNPDLKQEYSHDVSFRYGKTNAENAHSFFVFLSGSATQNQISTSTFIASQDSVLTESVTLYQGSQLSKPINLDGYWNARSFLTYGLPIESLKSNLNLNAGVGYTHAPGLINDQENLAGTVNTNAGMVLSSNMSENLDFTVSYSGNYNLVKNTLDPTQDNNYFYQNSALKVNWIFGDGIVLNTDMNHTLYAGLNDGYNQQYLLWNAGLGYKFLKKRAAEIKLTVFDLLNQNNSITRNITETYVEDSETRVLQRYFMLTFTYNLRNFVARKG